ncbi:MAG: hypothetical protein ACYCYP_12475 [Leptospirales bacterium]
MRVPEAPSASVPSPAVPEWLFLFRTEAQQASVTTKYILSNDPRPVSLDTLANVSKLRCSIERSFLEDKDLLGMDHYEHRSWQGWHRHMLYVLIAHAFLQTIRLKFSKKSVPDPPI